LGADDKLLVAAAREFDAEPDDGGGDALAAIFSDFSGFSNPTSEPTSVVCSIIFSWTSSASTDVIYGRPAAHRAMQSP
jgi:hypothetical protein